MKKIIFIIITNLLTTLWVAGQNKYDGVISFEQTITLHFDTTKDNNPLLLLAEGKKVTINYKIIFSDSISKKYLSEDSNCSLNKTYAYDSENNDIDIYIRNTKQNKELEYQSSINRPASKTFEREYKNLSFKYTGKTKKILTFNCKEIEYTSDVEGRQIKISAYITTELPLSAGFEIFRNLDAAIIEMNTKGRQLTAVAYSKGTKKIPSAYFLP